MLLPGSACWILRFQFSVYGVFKCGATAKTKHWLSMLHAEPEFVRSGKIAGPVVFQLITLVSRLSCRNEVMVPFPGVTPSAPAVGFKFRPPPLKRKVRIDGCEKMIPLPPRSTVLPVPKMSHANPRRGEMLL